MNYAEKGFSVEAAIAKGRPIPEWALDKPELDPVDMFYINAFYDLNTCRQSNGQALGPIPWSDIYQYSLFSGLDNENTRVFIRIIGVMDASFLKRMYEKVKKANTQKPAR